MHRVVVVGGGFGGLAAARNLRKAPVLVTLVDRRNHHLFQPLLYQVATGALSPANIATPLRRIVRRQQNVRVVLGEVVDIDVANRRVVLPQAELPYDTLIVAAGSSHSYFGKNEWAQLAPGLKSIDDATAIRRKVLLAFEQAELVHDPELIRSLLTFVVVGAGPTGVELAGAIAEIANDSLRHEFRHVNPRDARILLVEFADRVLTTYHPELSEKARQMLEKLGVQVMTGWRVVDIAEDHVTIERNEERQEIPTRTVVWAAGVQASPLSQAIQEATSATTDRTGRLHVEPDLSLPGHPEIFIIGDMAYYPHQEDKPLPALAPVAQQQGEYVARLIASRVTDAKPPKKFHYKDRGTMATVGRLMAVADLNGWRFSGALAWFAWLFIHLMQLVQRESRILVLIQWAYHYFTRNRSARLITGKIVDDERRPGNHPPKREQMAAR
jgi:NADH:ubiquinone reductase (H+-translocating)